MKNSTKFLDDIMENSIQRNIVIDVIDKPTFEDWWRFEEECLGEHFGMPEEDSVEWWNTWFTTKEPDNFIMLEISIKDGRYEIIYITEVEELECVPRPIDLLIPFSEIYNKYLLKPLPETLVKVIEEQPKEFDVKKAVQDILEYQNKAQSDAELILEEQLDEAQEEIDSLTSTIKDMEEIIKRYEHNLTFIWTMLEEKIKESKIMNPEAGDIWYVILPHTHHISEAEILEVTTKTVKLKVVTDYSTPTRYKIEDIEFIEHRA